MRMNLGRWLMLIPAVLLGATSLLADTVGPDFEIILDGFDPGQSFGGTANQPTPTDLAPCLGTDCGDEVIIDPLIRLNPGGGSEDVGLGFSFNANADGTRPKIS